MVLLSFYRRGGTEAAAGESRRRYSMFGSLIASKSYDNFKRNSTDFEIYTATIHTAEVAIKARPKMIRAKAHRSSASATSSLSSRKPSLTRSSTWSNMSIGRSSSAASSTDSFHDARDFNKPLPPVYNGRIGT